MKRIAHAVFTESVRPPIWACFASERRERRLKKIRQQAEAFINEIAPEELVSIAEHAPTFGLFSIAVWWLQEVPDADTPVIRALAEKR